MFYIFKKGRSNVWQKNVFVVQLLARKTAFMLNMFFSFLEMWYLVVEIKGFLLWDHGVDESCNDSLKF